MNYPSTAFALPGSSHFSYGRFRSSQSVLAASRGASSASRYSGRLGRDFKKSENPRSNGSSSVNRRPKDRDFPTKESYFIPQDDSEEEDESDFSDEFSDYDEVEEQGNDLTKEPSSRRSFVDEEAEKNAFARRTVKSYLQRLRSRRLNDKPPPPPSNQAFQDEGRHTIRKSAFSQSKMRNSFPQDDAEESSEVSHDSGSSEAEKESSFQNEPTSLIGTEQKTSVRSYLQKLKAQRVNRKLAESSANEGEFSRKATPYESASEEDQKDYEGSRPQRLNGTKSFRSEGEFVRKAAKSSLKKTAYESASEEDQEDYEDSRPQRSNRANSFRSEDESIRKAAKPFLKKPSFESASEEDQEDYEAQRPKRTVETVRDSDDSLTDSVPEKAGRRRSYRGAKGRHEAMLQDAFFSIKSFRKLGASYEVIDALASLEILKPSEIQALSYKEVARGNSCIIADQTGSGKTLAYLAPLVQRLRDQEEQGKFSTPKNPRVLILVPTSELAMQVLSVCRALSKTCPLKSMVATGGFKWKTQVESLKNGPDIVVATPGRFLHHLEQETMQVNKLQSVILDEVDILFEEEEFVEAMRKLRLQASEGLQYIHVTATLPTDVHDKIINMHPDSIPLLGPSLHLTAPGLNEVLVDCSGGNDDERTPESAFANKKDALLNLLQESTVAKTIIFCNKIETCRKVENILKRYDRSGKTMSVLPYHAALSQEARLQSMQDFMTSQPETSMFLVCTDRASRGLDSIGVGRVILFDFPRDPSEYIRRVGRTARAGGAGKVFVFVVGKQVSLARKVMSRNEKRHPVHTVPGASHL